MKTCKWESQCDEFLDLLLEQWDLPRTPGGRPCRREVEGAADHCPLGIERWEEEWQRKERQSRANAVAPSVHGEAMPIK